MGLNEKRAMKAAEEGWMPARQKELKDICGADIPYEVDWESFAGDIKGMEWIEYNGPQQISGAFRGICKDDLGKEAIRESLKKIVIRNVKDPSEKAMSLQDGVFTLSCAFAKSPGGRFKDMEIRKYLEENI